MIPPEKNDLPDDIAKGLLRLSRVDNPGTSTTAAKDSTPSRSRVAASIRGQKGMQRSVRRGTLDRVQAITLAAPNDQPDGAPAMRIPRMTTRRWLIVVLLMGGIVGGHRLKRRFC
jgi:hypothetical protein